MRTDVCDKITNQIVEELERAVRPWLKPRNAEHASGRITRPFRGNGIPYQGKSVCALARPRKPGAQGDAKRGRWHQRLQQRPFAICQIACIAKPPAHNWFWWRVGIRWRRHRADGVP